MNSTADRAPMDGNEESPRARRARLRHAAGEKELIDDLATATELSKKTSLADAVRITLATREARLKKYPALRIPPAA